MEVSEKYRKVNCTKRRANQTNARKEQAPLAEKNSKDRFYLERFSIRTFKKEDIDFAHKMVTAEHWNDRREDIERMFNYEPNGCFIAEADREPAGHVFTVNYEKLGWIGLLIVKAEYRRKQIGTLLVKKAIDYLLNSGVETIRLEAVPSIAGFYRELGFIDEYESLRFTAYSNKIVSPNIESINPMQEEEISEIADFDAEYFGANRMRVLSRLYRENPDRCFVSRVGCNIVGYAMSRRMQSGYRIGPWTSTPENPKIAQELLTKCMETIKPDTNVYVGMPELNKTAAEILQKNGFKQYSKSIRMRLGKKLTEHPSGIFAIGGPMKG